MEIRDEIVEKARDGYFDAMLGSLERRTNFRAMRAALEAVAPAIRAAAMEEAAVIVETEADRWGQRNNRIAALSSGALMDAATAIRSAKETT
jgi:hypothetical protein